MGESYIQSQLELLKILPNSTSDEVFTGEGVALEMVTSLVGWIEPDVFKNPSFKFLDIYTKSGIFLLLLYEVLMENLADTIADESERSNHILSNMLYGISPSSELALVSRKTLYGNWSTVGNIKYLQGYKDKVKKDFKGMDKELGTMKFDVVIGNPPYNNDVYLDFVTLAHQLSSKYTCMITPAKWQAKGGEKNEKFRRDIVPYMSHIVYYPDTLDIFSVDSQGGISYFLINKNKPKKRVLETYCNVQKLFETDGAEDISDETLTILYNQKIRDIVHKLGNYRQLRCTNTAIDGKYNVAITNVYSEKNCTSKQGQAYVTISPYIVMTNYRKNADTSFLDSFKTEDEARSYISYLETKFIRFMFLMAKTSLHMQSDFSWRFVPDPGPFDHIFTDEELYQKYNLTPDEINIIESVIKERK